ncbi:MAG: dephospho-CoA kinase [Synechocystis sp.]|jgi:dephospho-CoA kinase
MGRPTDQRLIGLTGGIATGKSTVATYLQDYYGIPILDADVYARDAVQVNSPILRAIANRYGPEILQADGSLNRGALGDIIFNNHKEKAWVENQIHPYVKQCFLMELVKLHQMPMVILVIPLLFEAELTDWVREIWVVTCSPANQLKRLMTRNGLSRDQSLARIASQMSLTDKVARAHIVLANDQTVESLHDQIDQALLKSVGLC